MGSVKEFWPVIWSIPYTNLAIGVSPGRAPSERAFGFHVWGTWASQLQQNE
jgi:hypothetical protein